MCVSDAPGGENMNYIAATVILPKTYLAKSGPDICYFRNNDQHQHEEIGCAAANPRLLHGKPLYYGTTGLVNGKM